MKYLPAIRILLKKAVNEEQRMAVGMLELKAIDTRKNPNFSFSMEVKGGKIDNSLLVPSMGRDLVSVLNRDPATRVFLTDKNFVIGMTNAAMLNIRHS